MRVHVCKNEVIIEWYRMLICIHALHLRTCLGDNICTYVHGYIHTYVRTYTHVTHLWIFMYFHIPGV